MTEAELLDAVTGECDRLGLMWVHNPDSRLVRGTPGLPDLLICSLVGLLLAELKGVDGQTSAEQDLWAWTLRTAGVRYRLWRPANWESGEIRADLALMRPR